MLGWNQTQEDGKFSARPTSTSGSAHKTKKKEKRRGREQGTGAHALLSAAHSKLGMRERQQEMEGEELWLINHKTKKTGSFAATIAIIKAPWSSCDSCVFYLLLFTFLIFLFCFLIFFFRTVLQSAR
jgi:hypothetical protein